MTQEQKLRGVLIRILQIAEEHETSQVNTAKIVAYAKSALSTPSQPIQSVCVCGFGIAEHAMGDTVCKNFKEAPSQPVGGNEHADEIASRCLSSSPIETHNRIVMALNAKDAEKAVMREKQEWRINEQMEQNASLRERIEALTKENSELRKGVCEHIAKDVLVADCVLCESALARKAYQALTTYNKGLREGLAGLIEGATKEFNEKGAGGYALARLSDAKQALEQFGGVR